MLETLSFSRSVFRNTALSGRLFLLTVSQIGPLTKESSCVCLITRIRTTGDGKQVDYVQSTTAAARNKTNMEEKKLVSGPNSFQQPDFSHLNMFI